METLTYCRNMLLMAQRNLKKAQTMKRDYKPGRFASEMPALLDATLSKTEADVEKWEKRIVVLQGEGNEV